LNGQGAAHDVRLKPFIEMPALLTSAKKIGSSSSRAPARPKAAMLASLVHVELSAAHVARSLNVLRLVGLLRVASREHGTRKPFFGELKRQVSRPRPSVARQWTIASSAGVETWARGPG